MFSPRLKVLALDLEGTLVSNAVSQLARPGLRDFLSWALAAFERVVLFTAVPEHHARRIMATLVDGHEAPPEAADIPYVRWSGPHKDLRFVGEASVEEILIVDDQERFILPEQRAQWVRIAGWDSPCADADRELERVKGLIEARRST